MSKSTNTKDELRPKIGVQCLLYAEAYKQNSEFVMSRAIDNIEKLIAKDRQQLIKRIKEELPEPKQEKYVLEHTPNVTTTEESMQRYYRYGGYDFALHKINQILETMEEL